MDILMLVLAVDSVVLAVAFFGLYLLNKAADQGEG
jgi:hypothetical protein